MKRHIVAPRSDWIARVEEVGFTYHSLGLRPGAEDGTYWDEAVAYEFTSDEVDIIEAATTELHRLCLAASDHIVEHPELMDRFGIPAAWRGYVTESWRRRDPCLYGRFDLAFDPANQRLSQPKMLEYNADTPTTLLESAVVQWFWLEETLPGADQFNSIHDRLIARWREFASRMPAGARLHLSSPPGSEEERQTVSYLADVARQAGLPTSHLPLDQVGWRAAGRRFVGLDNEPIRFWFKLYPWEWMITDAFGPHLLEDAVRVIEPAWKMLLSNKAILPLLWELFPGHPNLLPASFEPGCVGDRWVAKPVLAREGANLTLWRPGAEPITTGGTYADAPVVFQEAVELPCFAGHYAVIGSWVVGDEAAGMILREDERPIIVDDSRVVPHFF